jgi:hypothetical protein
MSQAILSNALLALRERTFKRVFTCIFIGNMVVGVHHLHEWNVWSDMLALAINATSVLIHLSNDICVVIICLISDQIPWNYLTVLY